MPKKSMPWLRLYTEFSTDHKVQMMTEAMQRRLIMLFCLQREGELNSMSDNEICHRLRISKTDWKKTRNQFEKLGFLNEKSQLRGNLDVVKNFSTRQFDSDDAAQLKRKQREKARFNGFCPDVVLGHVPTMSQDMSQRCLVTDPDTETETEEEEESNNHPHQQPLARGTNRRSEKDDDDDIKKSQKIDFGKRQAYVDYLTPLFPTIGVAGFMTANFSAGMNAWVEAGVTVEDLDAAVKACQGRYAVSRPDYYLPVALQFCNARKETGSYNARGSPKEKSVDAEVQAILKYRREEEDKYYAEHPEQRPTNEYL